MCKKNTPSFPVSIITKTAFGTPPHTNLYRLKIEHTRYQVTTANNFWHRSLDITEQRETASNHRSQQTGTNCCVSGYGSGRIRIILPDPDPNRHRHPGQADPIRPIWIDINARHRKKLILCTFLYASKILESDFTRCVKLEEGSA